MVIYYTKKGGEELKKLLSRYSILFIFILAVCLYTRFYMSYTSPKDIQLKYDGIKFQCGNLQSAEPISIEINGKLTRELRQLFVKYDTYGEFNGTIKVGEKIFTCSPIVFNKDKWTSLETSVGLYGDIFINDMFQKLPIEILEPLGNGGYSWNANNGWMVSAPCNDRIKATEISNILEEKLLGYKIK